MKLDLRNFKTVIILHIKGEVSEHDVEVLSAGIPKIEHKKLPLILDFEKSTFKGKAAERIDALREAAYEEEKEYYFVSRVLEDADAKTFQEALEASENPDSVEIMECIRLNEEIHQLQLEDERMDQALQQHAKSSKVGTYDQYQKTKRQFEWMTKVLEKTIKEDDALLQTFQTDLEKRDTDEIKEQLRTLQNCQKQVLELMKEKGIS